MTPLSRPRRLECTTHENGDTGELLVLDPGGERVIVLNPVGAAVFGLCDGTRGREDIVRILVETLRVDPGVATADVERFLTELMERGVVVDDAR